MAEDGGRRTVRKAGRAYARRLVARQPGQAVLVAFICVTATAATIFSHLAAVKEGAILEQFARLRYGLVAVVADPAEARPPDTGFPIVSHAPDRNLAWFSSDHAASVESIATAIGIGLVRRVELAGLLDTGEIRTVLAVTTADPGRALVSEAYRAPVGNPGAVPRLSVALRRSIDGEVEWYDAPATAVIGESEDGTVWVTLDWIESVLDEGRSTPHPILPVANLLVAPGASGNAFTIAFDLAEQLHASGIASDVVAWPEAVGYQRYMGVGSTAGLVRPLVLLVAAVAIAGAVAVAARNRMRDVVVLRTIGFELGTIRSVFAWELLLASVAATGVVVIVLFVASVFGAPVLFDAPVRRALVGGVALPPIVGFVTARRMLRAPLGVVRREADL